MRFTCLAAGIVCLAGVALAQPAPGPPADACCCCDVRRSVISCTRSISKKDCVCAAVACPAGAKTVWDDGKPTRTVDGGSMSILTAQEGGMTILPFEDEGMMSILPAKDEGVMTILPFKDEGIMSILPAKDEEDIMSILPAKEEGIMSILPVKDEEGIMSILPFKDEGIMSILPVKEEGPMSILPFNYDNQRMTILPVQEAGKRTPMKETGRMAIMPPVKETGRMTIMAAQSTPAAKAPEKRDTSDNEDGTPVGHKAGKKTTPALSELPKKFITKAKGAAKDAEMTALPVRQFPCCCCNIGINKMVCEVRDENDCVCPTVMCPRNAETIFVRAPAPTGI
ncbi:hypothetical protein C2857_006361 [Epichloe festucae Fl1]|uniref:Uncharacterized protein n=1 Tax=Epichloe festucae (strain Fl1) TaxID=877507 RepID=A0A7S9KTH7_EPIFF|nr:hypothetical protein C2857_006361 [Epichloe festucae Fl1]